MPTEVKVPAMGESVTQAILLKYHKKDGDTVSLDEPIAEMETDKANVDIPAPVAGIIHLTRKVGDTVAVGDVIATVDVSAPGSASPSTSKPVSLPPDKATGIPSPSASSPQGSDKVDLLDKIKPVHQDLSPAVTRIVAENNINPASVSPTGPGSRITKGDVLAHMAKPSAPAEKVAAPKAPPAKPAPMDFDTTGSHREPMTKIRKRISENLLRAQSTAAILTTFNEVDMTEVFNLRAKYKDKFTEVHGIGLGLMSFFVRAAVLALKEFPRVNAFIEGDDVIFHNYVHMGIAVSTERGLAVPVMRNAQEMSFARIESEIKRLATATRDNKLAISELSGGTFTITNGGVFGSLLSTPIINPPQSGILGMHTIQKRPVAIGDKVEIRPMMYLALSYDHRLVDGRDSVSFLVRLKQLVEDPARLMLEV